jgi:hypothetical protein
LLRKLSEVRPERLDWLGVSFGITLELLRFWKKAHFTPIYVRQTAVRGFGRRQRERERERERGYVCVCVCVCVCVYKCVSECE